MLLDLSFFPFCALSLIIIISLVQCSYLFFFCFYFSRSVFAYILICPQAFT